MVGDKQVEMPMEKHENLPLWLDLRAQCREVAMAIALVKSKSPTSGESWSSLLFGLLCVLAAIGALTFCSPAVAQDERLTRTTKTAHDLVILGYARSNKSFHCLEPPALYLDHPPYHRT